LSSLCDGTVPIVHYHCCNPHRYRRRLPNNRGTTTTILLQQQQHPQYQWPCLSTAALQEIDEKLTHEFIHIYDVRSLHLNLLQCKDLAYSEIRAAREAECASLYHNMPNHSKLTAQSTATNTVQPVTTAATTPSPITVPTPWSLLSTTKTSNNSSSSSSGSSGSKINNNIQASTANHTTVVQHDPQQQKLLEHCVRTRATTATQNLFHPFRAKRCVQHVFAQAMADYRPYHNNGNYDTTAATAAAAAAVTAATSPQQHPPLPAQHPQRPPLFQTGT
jgi:Peptidase M76 family